jgi:hypothetical protein
MSVQYPSHPALAGKIAIVTGATIPVDGGRVASGM